MSAVGKAEGTAETVKLEAPKPIPTSCVQENVAGMAFRSMFVRLPEGITAQHLNDYPDIWRLVQANRNISLRRFDDLKIVDFDEKTMIEATVSYADGVKVILAKPRITSLPERTVPIFEDEVYKVSWLGAGWGVIRKADHQTMCGGQAFHTAQVAEAELRKLYPVKRVAA